MKYLCLLLFVLFALPLPAQRISSFPATTTVSNSYLFLIEDPLVANYKITFGTLISNVASNITVSATATNAQPPSSVLSNLVTSGFSTISNANMLFVAKNGNNSTAKRGRRDLPYATPTAAKVAAVAGDTIVVFPGDYSGSSNLFKNNVNWQGYGATLTYTNLTNDTGVGIFDDRFSGTVTSKITGFSFRYSTGLETTNSTYQPDFGPTNTAGCIVITNMKSQVYIEFDRLDYQDLRLTYAGALWLGHGTNCFIRGNLIQDINLYEDVTIGYDPDLEEDVRVASEAIGVYWLAGEHHVEVDRVACRRQSIYLVNPRGELGNFWFKGDYLFGQIYTSGSGTNGWRAWITFKELEVQTNSTQLPGAITMEVEGRIYIRGEKIEEKGTRSDLTGGTCIKQTGNVQSWINLQKASAGSRWLDISGTGTCWMDCLYYEDVVGITQGFRLSGGYSYISGQEAKVGSATGSAITHFSGNAVFSGLRLSATNSTGSPVILSTNGLVLQNCTLLAKPGTFSIRSTNAQSANILGCWSNTRETNLTYQVGPWTVDSNLR